MLSFLRRYAGPLVLFAGGVGLLVAAPFILPGKSEPPPEKADDNPAKLPVASFPATREPPTRSAAASGLSDGDQVIGVVARGKARAYSVKAMQGRPQNHVINDMIGGTPVTVTYFDIGQHVRVFTASANEPLDVRMGGTPKGEMVLDIGGKQFLQVTMKPRDPESTERFPFDPMPAEVTTWKKWRDAHPDTDVVVDLPLASRK